jgi:transcriptional regulator with XRE-family HTH domain
MKSGNKFRYQAVFCLALLRYRRCMSVGRPVERPVHLDAAQRQAAQNQTARWRELTGLSQKQMAAQVGVGHSTYRMWESGKEAHAGPTEIQVRQLDAALRHLLGSGYRHGEAIEVWRWAVGHEASFAEISAMLRAAGFVVPHSEATPDVVVWMHRLREPNIVHGILALAAAAAARARMSVRLLLDDLMSQEGAHDVLTDFDARVRSWFTFAGADDSVLSVGLFSATLTPELLAQRGWETVETYLRADATALDFLRAAKVVSPLQYSTAPERSVLELIRQSDSLRTARLLTPFRNWLVFDTELARLERAGAQRIVTLGAEDDRPLWELWHRGSSSSFRDRVKHIYLRAAPLPSYRVPWQEDALTARTSRSWLTDYLRNRAADGHAGLLDWFARAAVRLPAELNAQFRGRVDPVLLAPDGLQPGGADSVAESIAAAVVSWLGSE